MSEEERELLARIGQLAGLCPTFYNNTHFTDNLQGQINRHKNGQTGPRAPPNLHPAHHRRMLGFELQRRSTANAHLDNSYRHASSPYPARHNRIGRPPAAHQHKTLHLNADSSNASRSASSGAETPPGWVSRNDRHRQLINANVYERDTHNRAKAIEQTHQNKINGYRQREKTQFNEFLKHQAGASSAQTNPAGQNELTVQGVQFRVMDGGKKLVKIPGMCKVPDDVELCTLPVADAPNSSSSRTPKTATVAGVRFYRTKTGNLVASRIVNDHRYVTSLGGAKLLTVSRRSGVVKKIDQLCKIFSTTGISSFYDWSGPRLHHPNRPRGHGIKLTYNFCQVHAQKALGAATFMTPARLLSVRIS
jgi:hypothetical protein